MPSNWGRNSRRQSPRRPYANRDTTIIADRADCCTAPETVAEEIYGKAEKEILFQNCCDGVFGCEQLDTQTRCNFWPRFAHPRWLTCRQLHNRKMP